MTDKNWASKALLDLLNDPSEPFSPHARLTIEGIALGLQTEHVNGQQAVDSLLAKVKEVEEAVGWPGTGAAAALEEVKATDTKAPEPEPAEVDSLAAASRRIYQDLYPNSGVRYSKEEFLKMIRCASVQGDIEELASEFGRTKAAVITKMIQLGLINVNYMESSRRFACRGDRILNWAELVFAIGIRRNFERAGFNSDDGIEELVKCGYIAQNSYYKAPKKASYITE